MRLLSLATVAIAICAAGALADEPVRAPVPKKPEPPAIDGTYTLTYTSTTTAARGFNAKGAAVAPATRTSLRCTTATISKGEIVLGRRAADIDPDGWSSPAAARAADAASAPQSMAFTIDPGTTPMSIDVIAIDQRNKRAEQKGIVEVNGDRLTIALAKPGAERPKTMDEGEDVTLYYFKKLPPPPKVEYRIVAMTVGQEAEAEKQLNKLAQEGFELVSTTNPAAGDPKASPTTVHFVLKRVKK